MVSNLENNCRCSLYTTVWKRKVVEPKSVSVEEHLMATAYRGKERSPKECR